MKIKLSPPLPVTGKAHIVRTFSQQHLDLHIGKKRIFFQHKSDRPRDQRRGHGSSAFHAVGIGSPGRAGNNMISRSHQIRFADTFRRRTAAGNCRPSGQHVAGAYRDHLPAASRSRNASRFRPLVARGGYHDEPFVPELFHSLATSASAHDQSFVPDLSHSLNKYILIPYRAAGSPHGNIYNTDAVLLPVIQNPAESPEHLFPAPVAETVQNFQGNKTASGSYSLILPHGSRPVSRQYSGHMGAVAVIVIRHAFICDKIGKGADPVP